MVIPDRNKPYILWLGVCSPGGPIGNGFASRSAAEHWQQGAISGLRANGVKVVSLSHEIFARWPRGPFYIDTKAVRIAPDSLSFFQTVPYLNSPIFSLKNYSLKVNYTRLFRKIVDRLGPPSMIISYNVFPHTLAIAEYAKKAFNIKTKLLIADEPARGVFFSMAKFEDHISKADECAFFSWGLYQKFKDRVPSIHFEGGVYPRISPRIEQKTLHAKSAKVIMYCGSSGGHAGLQSLLEALKCLRTQDVELWITGRHDVLERKIETAMAPNCEVKILGFLEDDDLRCRMEMADVFINPYSEKYLPNKHNFPSKVLLYLPFLKPIISTWTAGLSPRYRDVLCVVSNDTPLALAEKIDEVLSWDSDQLFKHRELLHIFVTNMSWQQRASLLL